MLWYDICIMIQCDSTVDNICNDTTQCNTFNNISINCEISMGSIKYIDWIRCDAIQCNKIDYDTS